jgi:hypothetical protein
LAYYKANKESILAKKAKYRAENPEHIAQINAAYFALNKEKIAARSAAYCAANREIRAARLSAWQKANPGAVRVHNQNRRARKKQNGGKLSRGIAAKLFALQTGRCTCCHADLKSTGHHIDHIMPLALGGSNTDDNVQLLCPTCNLSKNAKHPVDFMQSRGFLL